MFTSGRKSIQGRGFGEEFEQTKVGPPTPHAAKKGEL
jgi:hypothetical protein